MMAKISGVLQCVPALEERGAAHREELVAEQKRRDQIGPRSSAVADASVNPVGGEIDRRRGKVDEAVKEFQASLNTQDSAVVRTMLARLYLEQKKTEQARTEVQRALKLAPNYIEAKQLLEHLQNSKANGGAQ